MEAEEILEQLMRTGQIDEATLEKASAAVHAKTKDLQEVDGVIQIPTAGEVKRLNGPGIKFDIKGHILTLYPLSPWAMTKLMNKMKGGLRGLEVFEMTLDLLQKTMTPEDFALLDGWLDDANSGVTFDTIETIFSVFIEKSGAFPTPPPSVSSAGRQQTKVGSAANSSKPATSRKKSATKTS